MEFPKTLLEAVRYFADPDVCHEFMIQIKWPDGRISCPKCGGEKIGRIRTRRMLQCKEKTCRKQFSAKVNTPFQDSPLPLDKWLVAVWCIANAKNGISSCELARAIGVCQKTAWFMLHRARVLFDADHSEKMEGTIESDETYVGGKKKNMHKSRLAKMPKGTGSVGKTTVHGLLQRGDDSAPSTVRVGIIPNTKRPTMHAKIEEHVKTGINVYTDALASYQGLDWAYVHRTIDHAVAYVEGEVHTNGLENFWCLLKRALGGTYVSVAPKHLTKYCSEQAFRFNGRKGTDADRFQTAMAAAPGKRLTWDELTIKEEELA